MRGFLDQMALGSRERVAAAKAAERSAVLRARCADLAPPPVLKLDGRFDLIAELKLRSPALGELGSASDDLVGRVCDYAQSGAAAVSVLTEPARFSGSLEHLRLAAAALAPLGVPVMRKDFLVDPYQLYEARAAGAGGALVIVRMLSRAALAEMLDCARETRLFVLVEAFDEEDVAVAADVLRAGGGSGGPPGAHPAPLRSASQTRSLRGTTPSAARAGTVMPRPTGRGEDDGEVPGVESRAGHVKADVLVGVNSRDLQTLAVVPERLEQLAPCLPREYPRVAESGLTTPEDAARMVRAGYDMALVGGALMSAPEPGEMVAAMLAAGRSAAT